MSEDSALIIRYDASSELLKVIIRKRKALIRLIKRFEQLSAQLEQIQLAYDSKVGSLFRRSSLLDREIVYFKTINRFMQQGLSYEDAVLKLSESQEQKNKFSEEFFVFEELNETKVDDNERSLIRKLWKKLMQKHHPDLSRSSKDKKKKEALTKVINNAYKAGDYKLLKSIEERELEETIVDTSASGLQKLLVDIENAIIRRAKEYRNLQRSEWYSWRKKPKKKRNELFKDLQRSLIREILQKEFILSQLKKKQQFI